MSFVDDARARVLERVQQLQAEGKIILPDELVRRVKAGPGPDSLGQAQQVGQAQSGEQHVIDAETLAIVGNLESAWTGQGGEAARMGLRPLADVSTSASTAMHDSQGTLNDQMTAFQATRDSLQDVSSEPPTRDVVDTLTPWDTDTEDAINQRNGAIQRNNEIYQGFTASSDANGAKMPIDYGQIADVAEGGFELAPPPPVEAPQHVTAERWTPLAAPPGASNGYEPPPQSIPQQAPPGPYGQPPSPGGPQPFVPAAQDGSTTAAGYTPPMPQSGVPAFGPTGSNVAQVPNGTGFGPGYGPGGPGYVGAPDGPGSQGAGPGPRAPGVRLPGMGGPGPGPGTAGGYPRGGMPGGPGTGGPGSGTGAPGGAGRVTGGAPMSEGGAGRGGAAGPGAAGPGGAAGGRGAGGGMPMGGAGGGKGKGGEDAEHKRAAYLKEADPQAVFGYRGRATPPVIGK